MRLKPEARKNILGLEAQLWSETIKGRDMIEYYMLPKLMGFAESAWAQERSWETIEDPGMRQEAIQEEWNVFANTLGQQELPRLSYLNDGYNYRVPSPGGIVRQGVLYANTSFPGLTMRYTTDGIQSGDSASVYTGAVNVSGPVLLQVVDPSGRTSRPVQLNSDISRLRND